MPTSPALQTFDGNIEGLILMQDPQHVTRAEANGALVRQALGAVLVAAA
jgi:hypothetical protein